MQSKHGESAEAGPTSRIEPLLAEVRACQICASELPHGPRPVIQASASARLTIAGQAPGARVHETGIPFNDPSGDRLRDWMGIDRSTFYDPKQVNIIPMGFCYPGPVGQSKSRKSSGDAPPDPRCRASWHDQIFAALPDQSLILVIGQYAQHYHLGRARKNTLTETVRSWRDYAPRCMVLPHPSPLNNIWLKKNPWFAEDVLPEVKIRVKQALGLR